MIEQINDKKHLPNEWHAKCDNCNKTLARQITRDQLLKILREFDYCVGYNNHLCTQKCIDEFNVRVLSEKRKGKK